MMEKKRQKLKYKVLWLIPVIIFVCLAFTGWQTWIVYRDTLMKNQKEQLLMTTEVIGENMKMSMDDYENDLDFLCKMQEGGILNKERAREYIDTQSNYVQNLIFEGGDGKTRWMFEDIKFSNTQRLVKVDDEREIWYGEGESEQKFFIFKKRLESGEYFCLVVNGEEYYQKLISDIHVGTNGYVVIKNSDGKILMHPEAKQWGVDVIEGRERMYPGLDYSSLQEMIEKQKEGKEGISEYYSYWWTSPNLERVRKVAAYVPAVLGNDFLIVSTVIDYDDFYVPIREGFSRIVFIFLGLLSLFLVLSILIGRIIVEGKKTEAEVVYLRELNELLEEIHRNEETIAHQQRLQIMGTMTSGIVHEFNNFLTPIMGFSELLMMELPEESDEYDSAKEIYEASEKAKDVIRQISTLSKKNVETVYKSLSAQKLMVRVLKMIESIRPANIHLHSELLLKEEEILGNSTQINQVILNICVNAVHAIGRKEGNLTVRAACIPYEEIEKREELNLSNTWSSYIRVDIQDDGCGMDDETIEHIFDPFFTTKTAGEGTGLGLALAQQIVVSHRGGIAVESEKDVGTIFSIYFPVLETKMQDFVEGEQNKNKLRIVVVDDNAKILELLTKNFAKLGVDIITCMTQEELRRCLNEKEMDVLVIDESLGTESGIDFCMSIQGKYPHMLKIVMTDCVTRKLAEAKKKRVVDDYVEKPVSDTTILETIKKCKEMEF